LRKTDSRVRAGCRWQTAGRACLLSISLGLLSAATADAATGQITIAPRSGEQFLGAAGCKSSSCHGGAGEKRSQYITWTQLDFHARAYAVLVNARSTRMAETLGLGQAQASSRCTVCHSPFQSVEPSRLSSSARADEGVSCESCHNAAARWLRGHTRSDWTYAMRVTAGIRDLRNYYVRANTCVACHQNLEPDLAAAGHPELRFELDGQSVAQPKHWRDEPGTGAKGWLVGQAVALRELSWALGNREKPDPESIAQWNGLVWLLGKVTEHQTRFPIIDGAGATSTHAEFIGMQDRADSVARTAAAASFGSDFALAMFHTLSGSDSEFMQSRDSRDILYQRAQRLVIGLFRLSVAAGLDSDANPSPENRPLVETIQTRDSFDPARFATALATYREHVINSSQRGQ
jgi:hypothetical protein